MTFTDYLTQTKQYSPVTAKAYTRYVSGFAAYLENEGITPEKLVYQDLIGFIRSRQKQGYGKRYTNAQLTAIRHWLDWLVEQKRFDYNVGSGLFIRGRHQAVPSGLLSGEELRSLYESYQIKTGNKQHYPPMVRNKVMVGLMVFQGLLPDEMHQLKVSDLDLQKAVIRVPSSRRSDGRTLNLEAVQLYDIQRYASESGVADLFFVGNVGNFVFMLFQHLRRLNPLATHAMALKMSILTQMLQTHDLRVVQAFAGHRYVSSTERYQTSHLQSLQHDLERFHPLG